MNVVKFFEQHGFSYEYPGFLRIGVDGFDFTVGVGEAGGLGNDQEMPLPAGEFFNVQIISADGEYVHGGDIETADGVLTFLQQTRDAIARGQFD